MSHTILYIDDDETQILLLGLVLKARAWEVEGYVNPDEGESVFLANSERYGLAFVDRRLGWVDGLAYAARMQKARPAIPVVLLTGDVEPGLEAAANSLGVRHVEQKPLGAEAFWEMIERVQQAHSES